MSQLTGTAPVTLDFELDHRRNAEAMDGTFLIDAFVTLGNRSSGTCVHHRMELFSASLSLPPWFGSVGMDNEDVDREKDKAWDALCRESGWECRICGTVPECGERFENSLCDDCRKMTHNYE